MPIVRPRAVEAEYEGAYVRGVMHGTGTLSKTLSNAASYDA